MSKKVVRARLPVKIPSEETIPQHCVDLPLPHDTQRPAKPVSSPPTVGSYHYPNYHYQPYHYPGYHPAYPPPPPYPTHLPSAPPSMHHPHPPHYLSPINTTFSEDGEQNGNQSSKVSTVSPVSSTTGASYEYPYHYGHYPPYYPSPPSPYDRAAHPLQHTKSHQGPLRDISHSYPNHPNTQAIMESRDDSSGQRSRAVSFSTSGREDKRHDVEIREKTNRQARKRGQELKQLMKMIAAKKERTKVETQFYQSFEKRRQRKNERSRERTKEKRAEMERILAIPEEDRTKEEKKWIAIHMAAKKRKNERDQIRRERLKMLAMSSSKSSIVSCQSGYEDSSYSNSDQVSYTSSSGRAVPTTIHTSASCSSEDLSLTQTGRKGHNRAPSTSRAPSPNFLDLLASNKSPVRGATNIDPISIFKSMTPIEAAPFHIPNCY